MIKIHIIIILYITGMNISNIITLFFDEMYFNQMNFLYFDRPF